MNHHTSAFVYIDFCEWPHDSNLTINVLLETLEDIKKSVSQHNILAFVRCDFRQCFLSFTMFSLVEFCACILHELWRVLQLSTPLCACIETVFSLCSASPLKVTKANILMLKLLNCLTSLLSIVYSTTLNFFPAPLSNFEEKVTWKYIGLKTELTIRNYISLIVLSKFLYPSSVHL